MLRHQVPAAEGEVSGACPDTAKQVVCGMAFVTAIHLLADKLMAIGVERARVIK